MDDFDSYFADSSILALLCKARSKMAFSRHKLHMARDISKHKKTNRIEIKESNIENITLQKIFPSRRNWVKLNNRERRKYNDSVKRNNVRLMKSVNKEKMLVEQHGKIPAQWYINLMNFNTQIRNKTSNLILGVDEFSKPQIIPKFKSNKNDVYKYRPIANYELTDKIVTSLLSKYLVNKFDLIFQKSSFAFRARSNGKIPNHHDAIIEILRYRKIHKRLWVSECDIQKFFDTVQHNHLLNVYDNSVQELNSLGINISAKAKTLFLAFLKSYSFSEDILILNKDTEYFKKYSVKPGIFEWLESELKNEFECYKNGFANLKVGIPQGNAISCFIANLILNNVDIEVKKYNNSILYVRYCDDMILAHKDYEICRKALEIYQKEIKSNFLLFHNPIKFENYKENALEFWSKKSKQPYFWGNKHENSRNIPYLSFVGYQIHYKGIMRIRKESLKKEVKKQTSETQKVLKSLGLTYDRKLPDINKCSRKSKNQIIFSLEQRLHSMSVGRVTLYNYSDGRHFGLCWTHGFYLIDKNSRIKKKLITRQMKTLDRCRERQLSYFKKYLLSLNVKSDKNDNIPKHMRNIYFGSPFSYYNKVR